MLTQERLRFLLSYDVEAGEFKWINPTRVGLTNEFAGTKHKGYSRIRVDGHKYMAHRLAWFYVYGVWPKDQLDHVNGNKLDNRITNLREACNFENARNKHVTSRNISGYKGVHFDKASGKWRASCRVNGRLFNIGRFAKAEDASAAYQEYASKVFGVFNPIL